MKDPTLFTDAAEQRTIQFPLRVSIEERQALRDAARARGTNPTKLVRLAIRNLIIASEEQSRKRG